MRQTLWVIIFTHCSCCANSMSCLSYGITLDDLLLILRKCKAKVDNDAYTMPVIILIIVISEGEMIR